MQAFEIFLSQAFETLFFFFFFFVFNLINKVNFVKNTVQLNKVDSVKKV